MADNIQGNGQPKSYAQKLKLALTDGPSIFKTFSIKVNKYFTNTDGTLIAKAAAPASLQTVYPVFTFGNMDRNGGYRVGQRILASELPNGYAPIYLGTFVWGFSAIPALTQLSGYCDIKNTINDGDLVSVYTDSEDASTTYVWIVQSNDFASVGSVIQNTNTTQKDGNFGQLRLIGVNYIATPEQQYLVPWHLTSLDNIGQNLDRKVSIATYRNTQYKLQDFVDVRLADTLGVDDIPLTQYLGINYLLIYACDSLQMDFKLLYK